MLPSTTDDVFFDCLSPRELLRYSRTCRYAYNAVTSYRRRTFQLHNLLSRYFSISEAFYFRYLQFRTGMLISGSTALQFFNRLVYPDSDLDIYVEHRFCVPIALWLQSIGYTFRGRKHQEDFTFEEALEMSRVSGAQTSAFFPSTTTGYFGRGVANVFNFFKHDPERKIQLITSKHSPLEVILNFHSTCVMNVITHEKAYSLYPKGTFEEGRSLIYSTEGSKQEAARQKYRERGWEMVKNLTVEELRDSTSAFATGHRYIGDSKCWTIPTLPIMDLPGGHIEINTWNLQFNNDLEVAITFMNLRTTNLRHSYLVADGKVQKFLTPVLIDIEDSHRQVDDDIKLLLGYARGT